MRLRAFESDNANYATSAETSVNSDYAKYCNQVFLCNALDANGNGGELHLVGSSGYNTFYLEMYTNILLFSSPACLWRFDTANRYLELPSGVILK